MFAFARFFYQSLGATAPQDLTTVFWKKIIAYDDF
jgi:hypothetical protein